MRCAAGLRFGWPGLRPVAARSFGFRAAADPRVGGTARASARRIWQAAPRVWQGWAPAPTTFRGPLPVRGGALPRPTQEIRRREGGGVSGAALEAWMMVPEVPPMLAARGYSQEDIENIMHGNIMRTNLPI